MSSDDLLHESTNPYAASRAANEAAADSSRGDGLSDDRSVSNECGPRDVMKLALPLIASTASMTVMNFVDRMYLMWHSPVEFAAAMPAGILHFALLCFPLGLASYVNTFVAQYHGAKQPGRIGVAVWQGMRIGFYCTPIFLLAVPLAPYLFQLAGHESDVAAAETIYFQVLALSSGAAVIGAAMTAFYTGRGKTGTVMIVDVVANALNIVLDYAMIFGYWGFPELGIAGAAWATTISQWGKVGIYWYLMRAPEHRRTYQLDAGRRFDAALMRRLLKFGSPNGLQMFVEMGAVTLFVFLIGHLGTDAMTATNLAFNVNSVAFLPMMGMGLAVSTIVGQQLGRNRADLAAKATWTAMWLTAIYVGVLAVMYVATPDLFLFAHALGTSAEDFEALRDTTIVLLRFVAVFCLFDMAQIMFASAIKGAGDTRFILWTTIIIAPLPVIAGWVGIRFFGGGLLWCWVVITLWIAAAAVIYGVRFWHGKWRTMRVIEPDLLTDDEDLASASELAIETAAENGGGGVLLDDSADSDEPLADPAVA